MSISLTKLLQIHRSISFTPRISIFKNSFVCQYTNSAPVDVSQESKTREISKDRSVVIPVETSIKYIRSKGYEETYGKDPVWKNYRRNHKGLHPPKKTRKTCIRQDLIATGNPCPICRDEYLVIHYTNVDLLKQFISPHTGEIISYSKTGVCQKRHDEILVAVEQARDYGLITFDVPLREYDYSLYTEELIARPY